MNYQVRFFSFLPLFKYTPFILSIIQAIIIFSWGENILDRDAYNYCFRNGHTQGFELSYNLLFCYPPYIISDVIDPLFMGRLLSSIPFVVMMHMICRKYGASIGFICFLSLSGLFMGGFRQGVSMSLLMMYLISSKNNKIILWLSFLIHISTALLYTLFILFKSNFLIKNKLILCVLFFSITYFVDLLSVVSFFSFLNLIPSSYTEYFSENEFLQTDFYDLGRYYYAIMLFILIFHSFLLPKKNLTSNEIMACQFLLIVMLALYFLNITFLFNRLFIPVKFLCLYHFIFNQSFGYRKKLILFLLILELIRYYFFINGPSVSFLYD
jgi:hypothetical protein